MNLSAVQIVIWVISLVVTGGITGGIGYNVGATVVVCPAPESNPPTGGMQYAPHNNSPSQGF